MESPSAGTRASRLRPGDGEEVGHGVLADQVRLDEPPRPEGVSEAPSVAPALPAPARPMAVEPLTASQVRLHLTVPPEFLEKLEAARLALSNPAPQEDCAEPGAVHIPAAVRREVWRRDQGCCQWPVSSGGILRLPPPAPARPPGDAGGGRAVNFTQRATALRSSQPARGARTAGGPAHGPLLPRPTAGGAWRRQPQPQPETQPVRSYPWPGSLVPWPVIRGPRPLAPDLPRPLRGRDRHSTHESELRSHGPLRPTECAVPPPRSPSAHLGSSDES